MSTHLTQSLFFIDVRVISLKWQIGSCDILAKILQKLLYTSRKKLFNTRCSWSNSFPFSHCVPSSYPFYMDAATLKLPFLPSHFILLSWVFRWTYSFSYYSPTLLLPLGLLDTTSYKHFQTLQSNPEACLSWYHSNYCAFKIIVVFVCYLLDNKLCENSS